MRLSLTQLKSKRARARLLWLIAGISVLPLNVLASGYTEPVERDYQMAPPAPASQSAEQMKAKSDGCRTCHAKTDELTMHESPAVKLGCTDCHGGDSDVMRPDGSEREDPGYIQAMNEAHVLPLYPEAWHTPSSRTPKQPYTLYNRGSREFIRFVNPGDYRVAELACGACHMKIIKSAKRSLMATNAMFIGGASYNNGVLKQKNYFLGEAHTPEGEPAKIVAPIEPTPEMLAEGILPFLIPLPAWETVKPQDVFRVFERGGRNKISQFPETGNPNSIPRIQLLEEPGRPDIRQSNRGPGTGARVAIPVLNVTKTRLNDPNMWFAGTNEQPGDYRNSGCTACHVVYANDRDSKHSAFYAKYGHTGETATIDPTIPQNESGHPIKHQFTRRIPTSQCMVCHMHQPSMFLNTFYGYTMWDYESAAPLMWPDEQRYPSAEEIRHVNDRNPEGAAPRGLWASLEFLRNVWTDINPKAEQTQFADYHGHGWNFRAVFKRDRQGHLLDAEGAIVSSDDPEKFEKAVHMSSIHLDKGMHCVDCHFAQDSHGSGHIYGEVALAVEIGCVDCHGTAEAYPNLHTSGPAALGNGNDLSLLRNPDGSKRFEWVGDTLIQRSVVTPGLEWEVSLVKDTVTQGHPAFNPEAARAKLVSENTEEQHWGLDVAHEDRAHTYEKMECYTCHTSWTTTCGGCHLPIQANWKTERLHYEGGYTRNYATYNPQVLRNDVFILGKRSERKSGKYAPIRSTSALVLSSTDSTRGIIYAQQPPISASGYSSQAFNPHFPHTVRKEETRKCSGCHISKNNNNNAIMANLLGYGTDFMGLVGYHAWVGGDGQVAGVRVTEWKEPQAVIGSYLHKYAYPDWYDEHQARGLELEVARTHEANRVGCIQLRGEYLYAANGEGGLQVFDVAQVSNKNFSQRIITAPFGPLGHDTSVDTENATCLSLVTTQPVHPDRNQGKLMRVINEEEPFLPIYNYAVITDSEEGLILVDINTLSDLEPRNNILERALTWNPNGVLDGARHIAMGGYLAYITTDRGLVIVNLEKPLQPEVVSVVPLEGMKASALQFRYLFVVDEDGLKVVNVTDPSNAFVVEDNTIALDDAHKLHVARTYAYVAAGKDGLVIVDIGQPTDMEIYQRFTADGRITDARDVVVASTNASLYAYIADGVNGFKVVQLTSPESQPKFYGYSPAPKPQLIAWYDLDEPALSLSNPLERDRAVDETGGQVAVFGRLGSGPLSLEEMRDLYLNEEGEVWYVVDDIEKAKEMQEEREEKSASAKN